jgi:hypothetical protein
MTKPQPNATFKPRLTQPPRTPQPTFTHVIRPRRGWEWRCLTCKIRLWFFSWPLAKSWADHHYCPYLR